MTIDTVTGESDARFAKRAADNAKKQFLERVEKNIPKDITASKEAYNQRLLIEFQELCDMVSNMLGVYKKVTPTGFQYYCYRRSSFSKQEIIEVFENATSSETWVYMYRRSTMEYFLYSDERLGDMDNGELHL